jgi:hypothetical protein
MRLTVLDSIRGLLLVQMTLDHLGRPFNYWLYQCFGFFSAAEGFFFLSGLVGGWAVLRKAENDPSAGFLRRRARTLWLAQVVPVLAFAALVFVLGITPPYGFAPFADHTVAATVLTFFLLHTPGWFDVLSLYAVLLMLGFWTFPAMARGRVWPLAVSALVWGAAQLGLREWTRGVLPAWSAPGTFDPFAWQFVYFLGAGAALLWPRWRERMGGAWLKLIGYILCFMVALTFAWSRRWLPVEQPAEFWVSRSSLGVIRLLNFLAFAALLASVVRRWPGLLDFRPTALLGRYSLHVFVWQSLLLQFWFLAPAFWHQAPWDAVGSLMALATLWIPAGWKRRALKLRIEN